MEPFPNDDMMMCSYLLSLSGTDRLRWMWREGVWGASQWRSTLSWTCRTCLLTPSINNRQHNWHQNPHHWWNPNQVDHPVHLYHYEPINSINKILFSEAHLCWEKNDWYIGEAEETVKSDHFVDWGWPGLRWLSSFSILIHRHRYNYMSFLAAII